MIYEAKARFDSLVAAKFQSLEELYVDDMKNKLYPSSESLEENYKGVCNCFYTLQGNYGCGITSNNNEYGYIDGEDFVPGTYLISNVNGFSIHGDFESLDLKLQNIYTNSDNFKFLAMSNLNDMHKLTSETYLDYNFRLYEVAQCIQTIYSECDKISKVKIDETSYKDDLTDLITDLELALGNMEKDLLVIYSNVLLEYQDILDSTSELQSHYYATMTEVNSTVESIKSYLSNMSSEITTLDNAKVIIDEEYLNVKEFKTTITEINDDLESLVISLESAAIDSKSYGKNSLSALTSYYDHYNISPGDNEEVEARIAEQEHIETLVELGLIDEDCNLSEITFENLFVDYVNIEEYNSKQVLATINGTFAGNIFYWSKTPLTNEDIANFEAFEDRQPLDQSQYIRYKDGIAFYLDAYGYYLKNNDNAEVNHEKVSEIEKSIQICDFLGNTADLDEISEISLYGNTVVVIKNDYQMNEYNTPDRRGDERIYYMFNNKEITVHPILKGSFSNDLGRAWYENSLYERDKEIDQELEQIYNEVGSADLSHIISQGVNIAGIKFFQLGFMSTMLSYAARIAQLKEEKAMINEYKVLISNSQKAETEVHDGIEQLFLYNNTSVMLSEYNGHEIPHNPVYSPNEVTVEQMRAIKHSYNLLVYEEGTPEYNNSSDWIINTAKINNAMNPGKGPWLTGYINLLNGYGGVEVLGKMNESTLSELVENYDEYSGMLDVMNDTLRIDQSKLL